MGDDGRLRDVPPLPHLVCDSGISSSSMCRSVRRRILRKYHIIRETNLAVSALNSLYLGYDPGVVQSIQPADINSLCLGQAETMNYLMKRVREAGGPPVASSRARALSALRVACSPYQVGGAGVGDVVPMVLDSLSVPVMGADGLHVDKVLRGQAGEYLKDPQSWMLQDASKWSWFSR